jgi:hypothetical protein
MSNGNALNWVSVRPDAPMLGRDASRTIHAPSFLKKLFIHLFLSTHSSSYRSIPLVCRLRGAPLGRWPCQPWRVAASESWCSAAVPARRGVLLPSPSRMAAVASPPLMRLMPPFCNVQPLPPARRLARRCCVESACCSSMFQLFQMFW